MSKDIVELLRGRAQRYPEGTDFHDPLWTKAAEIITTLRANGYVVAMRLLQTDEVLDDKEKAARDSFLTKENIAAAVKG